ncbi:uncharacterized protein F5147DRAFT_648216 [Suillus discolor]|uniref:Uncharacterized protein n=1 Tax=Suillus discolor TaxID=1912936 RepID=A0A9P7K079_9AGAM|nr:uncharacterized protein F5147DRAFT_648216 [Suillus discolor]KAG2119167.1 hypothetical protein F5147DRAFT_648216 [Suillus discolor]
MLSAPSNMPPSSFAGLPMQPPLDAAGTLVFCPFLKWEADAQEGLTIICLKHWTARTAKTDGMAHDHDFEFAQGDQLDYILDNEGNGFEEFQRALQTSMAGTRLDLSWGSRGPGAALEALCRMTDDELESLPDIQPITVLMPGKLVFSFASVGVASDIFYVKGGFFKLGLLNFRGLRAALDEYSSDERILFHFPPLELCTGRCFNTPISSQRLRFNTDNAAMIAWALMHRFLAYDDYPVDLRAKWRIEDVKV